MANNHSDSDNSSNDGIVPYGIMSDSDSNDNFNLNDFETPPNSPIVVDPYINPDDATTIPSVLGNWRREIGWPQYQQQPFDPRDFPVTREPPQQTTPILVTKVNELEGRLSMSEFEINNKASNQDMTITRQGTREVRQMIDTFGQTYNENLLVIEEMQAEHQMLVNELNETRALDEKRRRVLNGKMIRMGITIARLNAEKASTSGSKKKKKAKKA